jgi:restriction system protein
LENYHDLMQPMFVHFGKISDLIEPELLQPTEDILPKLLSVQNQDYENQIAKIHKTAMASLEADILAHIYAQSPAFFENLIIDLLLAMGYGSRRRDLSRRIGKSHDGGVDGLISQDELGLELILVQAKRLKPNTAVSVAQIRDFVGSLDARHATKGVFVTTGTFTVPARMIVQDISRRIVLINGRELAALMVRHNLGVKITESYVFKTLNIDYFIAERAAGFNLSKEK